MRQIVASLTIAWQLFEPSQAMPSYKPLVYVPGTGIQVLQTGDSLNASANEVDVLPPLTNGETAAVNICQAVYISAANTMKLARSNAAATSPTVGLVVSTTVAAAATGLAQASGSFTATTAQWDAVTGQTGGLTFGAQYYLDAATAGKLTTTPPALGNQYVEIGRAISTTTMLLRLTTPLPL